MENRADAFPDKLSDSEQQRIARALIHESTGETVLQMLLDLTHEAGKTLIMATYNRDIVLFADRVCRIQDGKLHITRNRDNLSDTSYREKSDKLVKSV